MGFEERIKLLERRDRFVRRAAIAGAIVIACIVMMGADPPGFAKQVVADKIVTKSLAIVDEAGNARLSMLEYQGVPAFVMFDIQNRPRMSMTTGKNEGFEWQLFDASEPQKIRFKITVKDSGIAGLSFIDGEGNPRGVFVGLEAGDAGVVFYDDKGEPIWSAP
jgi:hypothetical protein